MRKCLRCNALMVENLYVMASNGEGGIDVREKGIFKNALAKIKCAVCHECGYVENHVDNTERIKALINEKD